MRGGLFVFVLFALTPTPLPRGEGLFSGGSGSGWCFGFAVLRKTCSFACGSAGFCRFDGGGFGVVGRGGRCVSVRSRAALFAVPTPTLPHGGRGLNRGRSGGGGCVGFAVLRKTRGFTCRGAGFCGFDGGGFGVVGRELMRGGCCVGGRFDVGAESGNATPSPALPRCASLRGRGRFGGCFGDGWRFCHRCAPSSCGGGVGWG